MNEIIGLKEAGLETNDADKLQVINITVVRGGEATIVIIPKWTTFMIRHNSRYKFLRYLFMVPSKGHYFPRLYDQFLLVECG